MHKLVNMKSKFIPTIEASKQLGYDRAHVSRLAAQGKIKAIKLGEGRTSAWVFTQKDIDAFKASIKKEAA